MRERLIELIEDVQRTARIPWGDDFRRKLADYLLDNGVIVTPCYAMVEQFIKDGKFNNRITAHNGKYAVVYVDKAKWDSCPLIDITEQHYNTEKALERIQALKERERE